MYIRRTKDVLCTFNLRPVSKGYYIYESNYDQCFCMTVPTKSQLTDTENKLTGLYIMDTLT